MGFVEDRRVHGGEQLGNTRITQRNVGKKQVVIDHHQVSIHGLAPGQYHVADRKFWALAAQTVFAR